ncbi:AraC family transcriptional regulator [Luteolibacter sp. SL250]|uniref:AraC family transcriptional regulator n=1 Tax=Luteolibacter sp. SL250 TaxID=2995170 RepID=UPI002271DBA2|nr:AraC family transcriptional regulator [Luteolibacter sp. SL250]WAC21829.1 AraC family transcriptional regulator [Luteolibacter sp. SL250]
MRSTDPTPRFSSLIDRMLDRDLPRGVHLANEPGAPTGSHGILPYPRFSLCLSGTARYDVSGDGGTRVITLARGEAIAAAPGCLMEPHPRSQYLALGIVFTPEMTRFLLARKNPGQHRFLLAHHSTALLDEETGQFFRALTRPSPRPPEDPYLRKLLQLLLVKSREMVESAQPVPSSRKAWFTWQSACRFIQENFSQPIGRPEVAAFLNLHPNHLSRLFTRFSGCSFNQYLLDIRLRHAAEMLADPRMNIGDVARACGIPDTNYFIRCFRKRTGLPPARYRSAADKD